MISRSEMGFPNKASPNPQPPRTWIDFWMDRKHDSDSDIRWKGVGTPKEFPGWIFAFICAIGSKLPIFPYNRGWETQPKSVGAPIYPL